MALSINNSKSDEYAVFQFLLKIGEKRELFLKRKEGYFSLELLKGLSIAIGFHLLFLFGLKIVIPPNQDLFAPIAPIAVEVDLGIPQQPLLPSTQITILPIKRNDSPQLLEMPKSQIDIKESFFQNFLTDEPDFSHIEKIEYTLLDGLEDD